MEAKDRLIVALDVDSVPEAETIIRELGDTVDYYKVGLQLFTGNGMQTLDLLHNYGKKIFLDFKFHDIPNTVASAAEMATSKKISILTVHAAGGKKMMEETQLRCQRYSEEHQLDPPLVVAITVLTSLSQLEYERITDSKTSIWEQTINLARLAHESGLNGVVASPKEIRPIKQACGREFIVITPGVRPAWADTNDQSRTATPGEAITAGADYLVIGRPITRAKDRQAAAQMILDEMEEALTNGKHR